MSPPTQPGRAALCSLALAAATTTARADDGRVTFLPREPRAITRFDSASRDAPVFEAAYGPRAQASVGTEFGVLRVRVDEGALRVGAYGLIALENRYVARLFPPNELWRGLVGGFVSYSPEALARDLLGEGGALEAALTVGHESDHLDLFRSYSYALPAFPRKPGDIAIAPGGELGEFVAPELAWRLRAGVLSLTFRLQERVFFHGLMRHSPDADLVVRLVTLPHVQPLVALYGESYVPARGADATPTSVYTNASVDLGPAANAPFFRSLAGVAFRGAAGEVTPFVSLDSGSGKGFLINERETRFSGGVRYAPF